MDLENGTFTLNLTSDHDHEEHDHSGEHDHDHFPSISNPISVFQAVAEITGQKWLAMGVLALASTICGLFPYIMFTYYRRAISTDSKVYKVILATLSSLSGGVLLATTMLHILPEVREKSGKLVQKLSFFEAGFPIAEMLMLYGFCLIYFLEEIAHFMLKCKCGGKKKKCASGHNRRNHENQNHDEFIVGDKLDCEGGKMIHKFIPGHHTDGECQGQLFVPQGQCCDQGSSTGTSSGQSLSRHGSLASLAVTAQSKLGALRSLVSLMALSFHAIMEGIAVGVQGSSDLFMIFSAIASHKCIISLCLGLEMMKSNMSKKALLGSIVTFSIVSPLGILIGSVLATGEFSQSGWTVVVEGLASGTLLYVIFFEILSTNHEHDKGDSDSDSEHSDDKRPLGMVQFLGTFAGILVAGLLISTTGHSHDHGQENLFESSSHVGHNHDHPH